MYELIISNNKYIVYDMQMYVHSLEQMADFAICIILSIF